MADNISGEEWKPIKFDFEHDSDNRLEISNLGRIRSFNKNSDGNILRGSMINGYRILRMQFYKKRDTALQEQLNFLQDQVYKLMRRITEMKAKGDNENSIKETEQLLDGLKKKLHKKFEDNNKSRTIYFQCLVHRLVAEYFMEKPPEDHVVVAHLDHDKLNNKVSNLKWMTREENFKHQQLSPNVIREKSLRKKGSLANSGSSKLTITRVMLLKKLLNEGKPIKQLAKQFKISDTQVLRIKKGENWGDVEPAT